jgi:hypothetical protein
MIGEDPINLLWFRNEKYPLSHARLGVFVNKLKAKLS